MGFRLPPWATSRGPSDWALREFRAPPSLIPEPSLLLFRSFFEALPAWDPWLLLPGRTGFPMVGARLKTLRLANCLTRPWLAVEGVPLSSGSGASRREGGHGLRSMGRETRAGGPWVPPFRGCLSPPAVEGPGPPELLDT